MRQRRKSRRWSEEQLIEAIKTSDSFAAVSRKLDLSPHGGNSAYLKEYALDLNLDISHILNRKIIATEAQLRAMDAYRKKHMCTDSEIFCKNSKVNSSTLRKRVKQIFSNICNECKILGIYNNKSISLQVHHINGNNTDNTKENLCLLCPNCHSQTSSYSRQKTLTRGTRCVDCEIKIHYRATRCAKCYLKYRWK